MIDPLPDSPRARAWAAALNQQERADFLLRRKDELYALLVRVALCRELFAQLPADLQADIRAVVGDLIQ